MVSFIDSKLPWSGLRVCPVVGAAVLAAACGGGSGGGSGGSTFAEGVFLDSPVEGLRYEVGSINNEFTDADGGYRYLPGRTISFYLGDILLGSAQGAPVLTPLSIVAGGATGVADVRVTNMIRFLQTIDEDYDPSNGIRIAESTYDALLDQSLSFDRQVIEFANSQDVGLLVSSATAPLGTARMRLVPAITAQAHMRATLEELESPGGVPPATLGALQISGPAAATVGSPFEPDPALSFSDITAGFSTIEWNEARPATPPAVDTDTAVRFDIRFSANPLGGINQIALTWESQQLGIRSYGVACTAGTSVFPLVTGCPGVDIDLDDRTVSFSDVTLTLAGSATTMLLNGTLTIP